MVDVLLRNMETNSMVHRHGVVAMPVLLLGEVEAFKLLQNDEPAPDLQSSTSSLRRAMAQIWHNRLCQKMLSFQHPFPQWDMDAPLILAEYAGRGSNLFQRQPRRGMTHLGIPTPFPTEGMGA